MSGALGECTSRSCTIKNDIMDAAYISALAALAGSVIGGLTSAITTWLNQRTQAKEGQRTPEISRREELFRDFIIAASKAYGSATVSGEPAIEEIVDLYAMVSRMRVLCLPRTVECAEKIMKITIDTYFGPNVTIRELHQLVKTGVGIDPLKDFAEAAREELRTLSTSSWGLSLVARHQPAAGAPLQNPSGDRHSLTLTFQRAATLPVYARRLGSPGV